MANRPVFQLPFHGSWFVFWGGDTKKQNRHHDDTAEKYALDLVILDKNGKSYKGEGTQNIDYYAYGQDVLAVADGIVVEAVDGLRDNEPQKTTNDYAYGGNYVILKHSDKLFSSVQHLRYGSVRVKAGQQVKTSQKLGECGNSGNSSEPHLHFQIMDDSIFTIFDKDYALKTRAKGLKPYFELKFQCGDKIEHKARYSPVKGEIISP